jgi:hypothetical protein
MLDGKDHCNPLSNRAEKAGITEGGVRKRCGCGPFQQRRSESSLVRQAVREQLGIED